MRTGRLDRRITLQYPSAVQNDYGEPVVTWVDIATVWAEKVENNGQERFTENQYLSKAERLFRVRWSETALQMTTLHRVVFDGRAHDVVHVQEISRRVGIELFCYARSEDPLKVEDGGNELREAGGNELREDGGAELRQ